MTLKERVARGIPIIDANVSYQDFLDSFLRPLTPCLLSGLTEGWPAARDWATFDSTLGQLVPNFSVLKALFGEYSGCVTFCDETDANGDTVQREISVAEFIDSISSNDGRDLITSSRKTYLKDFHFMRVKSYTKQPYSVPLYFQDDWFSRFATHTDKDDFRFLYLGEHLSFTPLHHDVCMSHSWSTSLCGTKIWTFIPPELASKLYSPLTGMLPKTIDSSDSQFPFLEEARASAITVTQYPGETIFVPSGWHHQVINHGPTLSLNHNWFNGACLPRMYQSLCREHDLSTHAIRDLQDDIDRTEFEVLVQGLLKANYGMDWHDWWEIVEWNVKYREKNSEEYRMGFEEEKEKQLGIVNQWLLRTEVEMIPELGEQVMAFRDYLLGKSSSSLAQERC